MIYGRDTGANIRDFMATFYRPRCWVGADEKLTPTLPVSGLLMGTSDDVLFQIEPL